MYTLYGRRATLYAGTKKLVALRGSAARGKAAQQICSAMAGQRRNGESFARSAIEAEDAPHVVYGRQIGQEGDEISELGVVRVVEP